MKDNSFRKLKSVLGIVLIIASITGLFLWEWKGREMILLDQVLVAREEIKSETVVDSSMFVVKGIPKSDLLTDVLGPDDLSRLKGKAASQYIAKNGQIVMDYFMTDEYGMKQGESIFVIDAEWISMRSSALRRGDIVDIYENNGTGRLGTYRVAYVKDEAEREVKNSEVVNAPSGEGILERPDSTSVIDHIEIITTLQEYEKLMNTASGLDGTTPAALIIVQRNGSSET